MEDLKDMKGAAENKYLKDWTYFDLRQKIKYKADVKFNTRGTNLVSVILVILVSIVMFSVLCSVIPDMLIFVDNFMSVIQKK